MIYNQIKDIKGSRGLTSANLEDYEFPQRWNRMIEFISMNKSWNKICFHYNHSCFMEMPYPVYIEQYLVQDEITRA